MNSVLIDTGPLVAILAKRDTDHAICVETFKRLQPPLLTTWAVLTEAAYLLRHHPAAVNGLFRLVENSVVTLPPLDSSAIPWIAAFYERYADQEPQLADASLIYLADQLQVSMIFTLDQRHFRTYRLAANRELSLLPEPR